ncbi:hypothetical protein BXZ70DRAFT_804178 [Cristinia sonorae]|uniref:Uncharacterized protein n=1 Tax=Cristinia sonorae TaxID=1940300 RepID=A0A8K0US25_9AGAR|nr:hypothetical protein BXZ70DRAFT_804178 [Cristinia sonorae]
MPGFQFQPPAHCQPHPATISKSALHDLFTSPITSLLRRSLDMLSSSVTTPNLSRESTLTTSSLSSSSSASLITPASATGPTFNRRHVGAGTSKIRGSDLEFTLDYTCLHLDGTPARGSPTLGKSFATAVRRAKTFAKRSVDVRRVISRSRRASVSECNSVRTDARVQEVHVDPHSVVTEEPRSPATQSADAPSPGSLQEVTQRIVGAFPVTVHKASASSVSLVAVHGSPDPSAFEDDHPISVSTPLHVYAARVALFVPWCIVVGGLIVFSPTHLSRLTVTTTPGQASRSPVPSLPNSGPQRFAYWAECAYYHVAIFLGCLACAFYLCSPVIPPNSVTGTCIIGALIARWMFVWKSGYGLGALVRRKRVQLGEDDAESVWLALTEKHLADGTMGGDDLEIYVGDVRMPMFISEDGFLRVFVYNEPSVDVLM